MNTSNPLEMPPHPQPTGHLDPLALELLRTGEASSADMAHYQTCETCKQAAERWKRLVRGGAEQPTLIVPLEMEEGLLALARQTARRVAAKKRRKVSFFPTPAIRRASRWIAVAAAACLLIIFGWWQIRQSSQPVSSPSVVAGRLSADLDGNGTVNILDAFFLARQLGQQVQARPEWDMNGDGAVDKADVQEIARQAVALKGKPS